MLNPLTLTWRDHLVFTRDITVAGDRREFYNLVHRGEFVRLRRGVYMRRSRWDTLNSDAQYRARVQAAVAFTESTVVVSHLSAAAIWRLPWFGRYPHFIDAVGDFGDGGRRTSEFRMHALSAPDSFDEIEGITVTSLTRTVIDIARSSTFVQSVVVADAALRRTTVPLAGMPATSLTVESLLTELARIPLRNGTARARRAIEFADGRANRPGESISRVNIFLAGLTAPTIQAPLRGASGRLWHVDFWWPQFNVIGEFDGKAKYTDEEYLRGRSPQQALYDEKMREDDLRAANHGFSRWPWETAISMPLLRGHLIEAGVR